MKEAIKKEILAVTHRDIALVDVILFQLCDESHVNVASQVCSRVSNLKEKPHISKIHYYIALAMKWQPGSVSRNLRT